MINTRDNVVIKKEKATDEDINLLRRVVDNYSKLIFDNHSVTGIGIGQRKRGNKYEDELVIKVYVKEKLPKDRVAKKDYIPPFLEFENKKFATDVEESEMPVAQFFTLRSRPLIGGSSIGTELTGGPTLVVSSRRFTGTLGVCVTYNDYNTYILSNNHVLALCDQLVVGDPVYQPSLRDGGVVSTDQVATLSIAIPIDFGGRNFVDCALARVADSFNGANREIHWVGYPKAYFPKLESLFAPKPSKPTEVSTYPLGLYVWKMGRTTEVTIGRIQGIHEYFTVDYSQQFGNPKGTNSALFVDQLRIEPFVPIPFSQQGDSGSLVLDYRTNQPVGLLFASTPTGTFSFCNKIWNVLKQLKIEHI